MKASPDTLADRLAARITADGPMPLDRWMDAANSQYYATRDPLGVSGDFTTAPEISQMFGELAGLWLADLWDRAGRPPAAYVELGPGRGTLARDALRAMRKAGLEPSVHLVETSPALRAAQAARLPDAVWHDTIDSLPDDRALLVVANEFFDALPVRQMVRTSAGWHERVVTHGDTGFGFGFATGRPVSGPAGGGVGDIAEARPAVAAILAALAPRIADRGGSLLTIDYGYRGPLFGDTLQAVRAHGFADPLVDPGQADLTAHVDFTALAVAAAPLVASGPVDQGEWLLRLGIATRAAALARTDPAQGDAIAAAYRRLTATDAMGQLFKVMALTAPYWPEPAGLRG